MNSIIKYIRSNFHEIQQAIDKNMDSLIDNLKNR
jgi:hypothetical protein